MKKAFKKPRMRVRMKPIQLSQNIKAVLEILRDEVRGNIPGALKKMTKNYTMTWVYEGKDGLLFPKTAVSKNTDLKDVYVIKDRKYEIFNIAEEI